MKAILRILFSLVAIGVLCERAQADGKFFTEKVPANIPYQRAFILFYEGSEILVLQSKFELSQLADVNLLGWVVPVPSVPEVGSTNPADAEGFFGTLSLHTSPKFFMISRIINPLAICFFLGCVGFLLICIVEYPFLHKIGLSKASWHQQLKYGLIIMIVTLVMSIITMPHLGLSRNVEIIKDEKAGIYDVKVIRSDSAEAILSWLKENAFNFSDSDIQVFEDYVEQKWCFVAAKVQPDVANQERKISYRGMVSPLVLKFNTNAAIYPLTLTSTIGKDTEILIYTLSEKKLLCGNQMPLRSARTTHTASLIGSLQYVAEPQTFGRFTNIPKNMILCKFKKRFKPKEMKYDLVFEFALDNKPVEETIIMW